MCRATEKSIPENGMGYCPITVVLLYKIVMSAVINEAITIIRSGVIEQKKVENGPKKNNRTGLGGKAGRLPISGFRQHRKVSEHGGSTHGKKLLLSFGGINCININSKSCCTELFDKSRISDIIGRMIGRNC